VSTAQSIIIIDVAVSDIERRDARDQRGQLFSVSIRLFRLTNNHEIRHTLTQVGEGRVCRSQPYPIPRRRGTAVSPIFLGTPTYTHIVRHRTTKFGMVTHLWKRYRYIKGSSMALPPQPRGWGSSDPNNVNQPDFVR